MKRNLLLFRCDFIHEHNYDYNKTHFVNQIYKEMSKKTYLWFWKRRFRRLTIPPILPPITPRIYNFIIVVKLKNEIKNVEE